MLLNSNCANDTNINNLNTMKFTVGGLNCPQTSISYVKMITSYNDPTISQKMRYSQYLNSGRNTSNIVFKKDLEGYSYKNCAIKH